MFRLLQYFGKFQSAKGALTGLPGWAKGIVFILAIPGLILILLSIAAFLVSMLALFLLTIPAYRCLRWVTGSSATTGREQFVPAEDFQDAMQQFVQIESNVDSEAIEYGTTTVVSKVVESPVVSTSTRVVVTTLVESSNNNEPPKARRNIEVKIVE